MLPRMGYRLSQLTRPAWPALREVPAADAAVAWKPRLRAMPEASEPFRAPPDAIEGSPKLARGTRRGRSVGRAWGLRKIEISESTTDS